MKANMISMSERSGVSKSSGKNYTLVEVWYQLEGVAYPFKKSFFGDDIGKVKAAWASDKILQLQFVPDMRGELSITVI